MHVDERDKENPRSPPSNSSRLAHVAALPLSHSFFNASRFNELKDKGDDDVTPEQVRTWEATAG
jgi:hypothetical protein